MDPEQHGMSEPLGVLKRRWRTVAVTVVIVVAAALVWARTSPVNWQASAGVLLTNDYLGASLAGITEPPPTSTEDTRTTLTQLAIANSPDVTQAALVGARMGPESPSEFATHAKVTLNPNSDIMEFSATLADSSSAERLATAWATAYTQYELRLQQLPVEDALANVTRALNRSPGPASSALRDTLLAKRDQLMLLAALQSSKALVEQTATTAVESRPSAAKAGLIALIAGLALAALTALLRDATDNHLGDPELLTQGLGVDLVGRLPRLRGMNRRQGVPVIMRDPTGSFSRSLRRVRAHVELFLDDTQGSSLAIAGGRRGDGATTVAASLAVSLARTGRHVIAVDLDVQDPTLHAAFDLSDDLGLVDCLHDRAEIDAVLRSVDIRSEGDGESTALGTLSIMPAGRLSVDPGELLRSPRFAAVMRDLTNRTDILVCDVPPLLGSAVGVTISQHVDAALLIFALPSLRRADVRRIRAACSGLRCAIVGVATTRDASPLGLGGTGKEPPIAEEVSPADIYGPPLST
jgi:Mrp family chromosome partitioning ATPase